VTEHAEEQAATAPLPPGRPAALAVLRDGPFRIYWAGQTLSAAGNAFSTLALAFAVLSLTRSATALGMVLLASRAPSIAFTLLGGVLGDRHARRVIMLAADTARTVIQAATAVVLVTGHADLSALAALQACAGTASSMFTPAASGLVADLAPPGQLRQANSLLGMSSAIAAIIAVAAAGGVVATGGPGVAFGIDAASFAASTISLALLSDPALAAPALTRRRLLRDLAQGWSAVRRRQWLCTYTAHVALLNTVAVSPFFVLGPLVADRHLGGAAAWAAIAASYAVGALAASGVTLRWRPHRPLLAAYSISLAFAPLLALLAAVAPIWAIVPAGLAAGGQASAYNTLTTTALQANIPRELLSRASSVVTLGGLLAVPIGMSLAGLTADTIGAATVLEAAAAWVLLSGLAAIATPSSRVRITLDPAETSTPTR
jgi:MFS family permease